MVNLVTVGAHNQVLHELAKLVLVLALAERGGGGNLGGTHVLEAALAALAATSKELGTGVL